MAFPVFRSAGTAAGGTGNVTPGLPPGWQLNDIFLLLVECDNTPGAAPSGWTAVTNSPVRAGGATAPTSLEVFWRRATALESAPTVTDRGDHTYAVILAFSGVVTSGDPWDVIATDTVLDGTSTSLSLPGATTTVDNCLVCTIAADSRDDASAARYANWANGGLTNVTERFDGGTSLGNGGGLGVATGQRATAGAFGATTVTYFNSVANSKAYMTIALRPARGAAAPGRAFHPGRGPSNIARFYQTPRSREVVIPTPVSVRTGSFTLNTSTGNQAISGLGFTPKAVIFWTQREFVIGGDNYYEYSYGAATSSTARWAMASTVSDFDDYAAHINDATKCIKIIAAYDGAVVTEADFVSLDADGFTINVTTAEATARTIFYLAIGGTDVSARAGTFNSITTTGNQAVTGVGFQPKATLFAFAARNTTGAAITDRHGIGLGCGLSSTAEWATHYFGTNDTTADEQSVQVTDKCIVSTSITPDIDEAADYVSNDANGFTINWTTKSADAIRIGYLALGGTAQYALGSFAQPASTGNQGVTGTGFTPVGELFVSFQKAASASPSVHSGQMVGAASSPTNRLVAANWIVDNVDDSANPNVLTSSALCLQTIGAAGTALSAADFVSQDGNGFTVNWTTADATARQILYLAIGSASVGGIFFQTLTETIALVDTVVKTPRKTLLDSIVLVDTVIRRTEKILSDAITLFDTVLKQPGKVLADTILLVDTILKQPRKVLIDAITLIDTVIRSSGKVLSDAVVLVDTIAKEGRKILTDAITLVDSVIASLIKILTVTDTLVLVDTIVRRAGKVLTDTIVLVDSIAKFLSGRIFTDTIVLVDSVVKGARKVLADVVVLADTIIKEGRKVLTDSITLVDTVIRRGGKVLTDVVTLVDTVAKQGRKILIDSVLLVDTVLKRTGKVLIDTVTLVDTVIRQVTFGRVFSEAVVLVDTVRKTVGRLLTEAVALVDGIETFLGKSFLKTGMAIKKIVPKFTIKRDKF